MKDYIKDQISLWDKLCKEESDFYHRAAVWSGLSDVAYWIMFFVHWYDKPISQSELCAENFFPKQTINSAIKKLVADEYVVLVPSEDNKKRKIIELTKKGLDFCIQYVEPIHEIEKSTFKEFKREEIDLMLSIMQRQLKIMNEKAEKLWQ